MDASKPQRRVRRSPEERRAAVSSAARAIALDEGLVGVTQRNVAAVAGMTPALVAHYAPGMDELVAETFGGIVGDELRELGGLLEAAGPDARGRLRRLLANVLDGSRDDVTLVWVHAWAIGPRNEALAARVRAEMDAWRAFLAALLERGVAEGAWVVRDVDEVAWLLLGMIDGLNAQALVRWHGGGEADAGGGAWRVALTMRAAEGLLGLEAGALEG